jgi:hypothetical protein
LFFTACIFGANGRDVVYVARSKIGIRALPIGSGKQFRVPLASAHNAAQMVMHLNVTAAVASLGPAKSQMSFSAPQLTPFEGKGGDGSFAFHSLGP